MTPAPLLHVACSAGTWCSVLVDGRWKVKHGTWHSAVAVGCYRDSTAVTCSTVGASRTCLCQDACVWCQQPLKQANTPGSSSQADRQDDEQAAATARQMLHCRVNCPTYETLAPRSMCCTTPSHGMQGYDPSTHLHLRIQCACGECLVSRLVCCGQWPLRWRAWCCHAPVVDQ